MFGGLKRKLFVLCLIMSLAAFVVPAYAEDASVPKQEAEVLGLLKKAAGYVGSRDACHNDPDASSALNIFEAILASAVKNNILPADLAPNIREMGRKTSNDTLSLFTKTPPMPCAEVHDSFLGFRTSIIGEYSSGPETAGALTMEDTAAPPDPASLQTKAEQGDVEAQADLGFLYFAGNGVQEDNVEAAKWLRKAAEQGHALAQATLASLYHDGEGVHPDAAEAVKWARKAAEQGNAGGQYILGSAYMMGKGVPKDYAEAAKFFRRAAEQGIAAAQAGLGFLYAHGRGVPQDNTQSVEWLRKAAEQGDSNGQAYLGGMYAEGRGLPQDFEEAYFWFNLAAISDDSWANSRDRLVKMLPSHVLSEVQKRARKWKPVHTRWSGADRATTP